MDKQTEGAVFDYRGLRLLMGLIAFSLPIVVTLWARKSLTSISASYYTDARDIFVGLLFIVGSFLFAYNGHTLKEALASRAAALAAFLVALFPTACDACQSNFESKVHYAAAAALFSILAYFCFIPFREEIKNATGRKARRNWIYVACGSVMIACIAVIALAKLILPLETVLRYDVVYWGEFVALIFFGVAWITSGKAIRWVADDDEMYHPFRKNEPSGRSPTATQ